MSPLLPIALSAAHAEMPPATQYAPASSFPAVSDVATTPANSFQSLLKQSSAALNNDSEPEASPSDRALKSGPASALLTSATPVPVATTETQPLPLRWSLNIFRNIPDPKSSPAEQPAEAPVHADSQASKQNSPAAALVTPAAVPAATPKPQDPPAATTKPALPQEPETSAVEDSDPSQPTQTPAAPQLPVSAFAAAAPAMAPALPTVPVATKESATPAASPAPKAERSRAQKPAASQTDNSNQAPATLQMVMPETLTAIDPVPTKAHSTPTQGVKPESTPTLSPVEPRAEEAHARAVAQNDATPKSLAPELAFALRVQPNSTPAAPVPVNTTPIPDPAPSGSNTAQPAVSSTPEPTQKNDQGQPATAPMRSAITTPAPATQTAQSSGSQNAGSNTDSDQKNDNPGQPVATGAPEPAAAPVSDGQVPQTTYAHTGPPAAPPALATTPATAPQTVATTASSSLTTPAAAPKTGTASQISISVPAGDQQNVQVRLMDRAGEVHVTVRAPNEELAGNLRSDLTSLTGKLNQSGFTTEAFTPSTGGGNLSRGQQNADPQQQSQSGSERQTSGRNQQQSSQQNGQGKRPAWLDEFESSLAN